MDYIKKTVDSLIKKYSTRDPKEICKELNIDVCYMDIGSMKGFYTIILRNKFIVVNENLEEHMQDIVIAHELGHAKLHNELAKDKSLQEVVFFDMKSKPEFEANVFAAHLLIDEKNILELAKSGYNTQEMASIINTDHNLLLIKLNQMSQNGYKINQQIVPKGSFLGAR